MLKLVEGLENSGRHLYCDNYYSSPQLFLALWSLGIGACGTVRTNRRGVPAAMRSRAKMTKGEVKSINKEGILSLQWMDKRKVTVISTLHNDDMVSKRRIRLTSDGIEEIMKPKVISDYNTHMGGVNKADQLLSYYSFTRRTMKWWKRVFFHLVDVAIVNSYIMYSESLQDGRKLTHEQFRVEVASGLLLQVGMSERDIEESIQYTDTIP